MSRNGKVAYDAMIEAGFSESDSRDWCESLAYNGFAEASQAQRNFLIGYLRACLY